jgi:hypothetical protein
MARTIEEIKNDIGNAFVRNKTLQDIYELDPEKSFEEQFSRATIESIIIYIMAYTNYVLEKFFDTHRKEVEEYIRQMKPHSLRWYVNKVRMYRHGQALIEGTDTYDENEPTEKSVDEMQVAKFVAATENDITVSQSNNNAKDTVVGGVATVYIKVAGGSNTDKQPLDPEEIKGLLAYIREIKDAGVRVVVINEEAIQLELDLHIYYNPMVLDSEGRNLQKGNKPVEDVVEDYIQNLPFNSEYRNADLIDRLQAIPGVVIPTLEVARQRKDNDSPWIDIPIRATPYSGYYVIKNLEPKYVPYESVSN